MIIKNLELDWYYSIEGTTQNVMMCYIDMLWFRMVANHGMWKWCEVDFGCELIVLSRWKGIIKFEINTIILIWDSYLSWNA